MHQTHAERQRQRIELYRRSLANCRDIRLAIEYQRRIVEAEDDIQTTTPNQQRLPPSDDLANGGAARA